MSQRLIELQQQRAQLMERIVHQRESLAREAMPIKSACDATDRAISTIRTFLRQASELVQRHPVAVAGLVAALIAYKPRRIVGVLSRSLLVWRSWRSLRPWLHRL